MTVVELMYIPMEVPNSSKLHSTPVRSPVLDGNAIKMTKFSINDF